MENLKELLKRNISIIIMIILILIIGIVLYLKEEDTHDVQNIFEQNENNINEVENVVTEETKQIAVHITGEVKKSGVIYLKEGSRIIDAVDKAGGTTKNADLSKINLAYVLQDGQKVYIPNKKEQVNEYISEDSGSNISTKTDSSIRKKININTANKEELQSISGVGPALAEKIVAYRNSNGKFKKIEDLKNVNGIGENKYKNIKDSICI